MPAKDESSPATKQDIRLLMDEIGKLYDANKQWKDELKDHFDLTVENIKHELKGANKDKLSLHDDKLQNHGRRIGQLEKHAGLVAA